MTITLGQALHRDLAPFADPATDVRLTESTKTTRLQMTRNGHPTDYLLAHDDGSVIARHANNRKFVSLRSLLASPDFADIRALLATQKRIYHDFDTESLIPPEGTIDGKRFALQTVSRLLHPGHQNNDRQSLHVVLLDGPAGVGKTSLIQRLLVQRSRSTQDSSSAPPILHIASRGKRLSSLDDVLAQSLQLIRASFTFDQTPSLIRNGLIQLAIDGFDELVDPEGYRDAWYALRDFFETTQFGEPVILAGRDTFFDQQRFSEQMKESQQKLVLNHVRLGEVSPTTAKTWLAARGWRSADLEDPYADVVLRPGSYTLRPYFLQELALAKSWGNIDSQNLTPRAYLVDRFLDRECILLGQRIDLDPIEIKRRLSIVFEETAIEMADTETDAVDLSFLQMTTEIAFGDALDSTDVAKLRHKSGSFAVLANDAREGFRRFPHSEIAHHFLSRALLRLVVTGEPTRFLRRGIIGADLLAIFAELFVMCSDKDASAFVDELNRILAREASFDRLPDNAASLVLTCLCRATGEQLVSYSDLQAPNVFLFGDVARAKLERIRIQRLDAAEASLAGVEFRDCEVVNLYADETTRFGVTSPTIHRLHLKNPKGGVRDIFDPSEIQVWIASHSARASAAANVNINAVTLLDKVCRVMLRQHMIKDHETDAAGNLLRDRYWPEIEAILTTNGLVTRVRGKQIAGTKAPFVRMKDPFALLANRDKGANVVIWKKVAAIPI